MKSKSTESKKSSKKKQPKKSRNYKQLLQEKVKNRFEESKQSGSVPTLRSNLRRSLGQVRKHWKPFLKVTSIYAALYFVFVRVLTKVDINELSETVELVFGGGEESFTTQILTVGTLFGESTNLDSQTSLIFAIITIICALAFIWVMRFIWSAKKVVVRDAFYQGMYPLIPFILVLLFMIIQLIPFSFTAFLFQTAVNNGLTSTFIEKLFFIVLFASGTIMSAYYLLGSIIALYAATVPGVRPSEARRTAKKILKNRRFLVLRQVIIFVILSGLLVLVPMLFIVWLLPQVAIVAAALIIVLGMPWFNLYFYGLYRDLIDG